MSLNCKEFIHLEYVEKVEIESNIRHLKVEPQYASFFSTFPVENHNIILRLKGSWLLYVLVSSGFVHVHRELKTNDSWVRNLILSEVAMLQGMTQDIWCSTRLKRLKVLDIDVVKHAIQIVSQPKWEKYEPVHLAGDWTITYQKAYGLTPNIFYYCTIRIRTPPQDAHSPMAPLWGMDFIMYGWETRRRGNWLFIWPGNYSYRQHFFYYTTFYLHSQDTVEASDLTFT